MVKRIADVVRNMAGVFSSGKKVDERRLLPVLFVGSEVFVVEPNPTHGRLLILPKQHATTTLVRLFRGTKQAPGPFPLFNKTTNIMDLPCNQIRRRTTSFIDHRVEYEVVGFHFCLVLGTGDEEQQKTVLGESGFKLKPLSGHSFETDIKRVLQLA